MLLLLVLLLVVVVLLLLVLVVLLVVLACSAAWVPCAMPHRRLQAACAVLCCAVLCCPVLSRASLQPESHAQPPLGSLLLVLHAACC
jgi:hypothetical protein